MGQRAPGSRRPVRCRNSPGSPPVHRYTNACRPDSIYKLTYAYKDDPFLQKVNLGVGAYRDDNSKPWVLPVIKKVRASSYSPQSSYYTITLFSASY